jgi:wyosine [tRNA(Phe)-imidazoG37] synthetase (radical SAM superfamily)
MPTHQEIKLFAEELAREISYNILDESEPSEIVLLSQLKKAKRFK